jgi:hypothetical protein
MFETAESLGSLPNLTRLDTVGTNSYATHAALHDGPHSLQIGKEPPGGSVVGMAHIVPCHGFLATNFTNPCHKHSLQNSESNKH